MEHIKIKDFEDYIQLYDIPEYIYEENDTWKVGVGKSKNEFTVTAFVNSIETPKGSHVNYIVDQITDKLREFFLKKHKRDVKASTIRNSLHLFINCEIINNSFNSQTKEQLTIQIKDFGSSIEISDKFIKKLTNTEIIKEILDFEEAKSAAAEKAELRKLNKEVDNNKLYKIEKFTDASEKNNRQHCILLITEGLSAASAVKSARDPKTMASYPLKGKQIGRASCRERV